MRPDCISEEMYDLLERLNSIKPVWMELGLQTIYDDKDNTLNRCYTTRDFEETYKRDEDEIPVYNADNPKEYQFSGNRIHRGLYKTADGRQLNADVNGALNIMRKSNVVDMNILYSRGKNKGSLSIHVET